MPSRNSRLAEVLLEHAEDRRALLVGEDVEHPLGVVVARRPRTRSAACSTASRRRTRPCATSPKSTQTFHSGRNASVHFISMNVANASFSQMPFHHFIVTRSPNHMCASSWWMTSATFCSSGWVAALRIDEQQHLAERDAAEVLHRAEGEVGHGDQVALVARIDDAVVVGEELRARTTRSRAANAVRCSLPGTCAIRSGVLSTSTGGVSSSGPTTNATRYVDIFIVSANTTRTPAVAERLRSSDSPAFDNAVRSSGTTNVTEKTALNSGSSQHGNASRAWVASNCVTGEGLLGAVVVGERRAVEADRACR